MTNSLVAWLLSFACAFCGLLYELCLAQTMAAALGNTVFRYVTTIAIFMGALGFGAAFAERANFRLRTSMELLICQLVLTLLGLGAPSLLLTLESMNAPEVFISTVGYSSVALIGFFNGQELPLLESLSRRATSYQSLLAADYIGMFVGTIVFPLLLLPGLGATGSGQFAAGLNVAMALYLAHLVWREKISAIEK